MYNLPRSALAGARCLRNLRAHLLALIDTHPHTLHSTPANHRPPKPAGGRVMEALLLVLARATLIKRTPSKLNIDSSTILEALVVLPPAHCFENNRHQRMQICRIILIYLT